MTTDERVHVKKDLFVPKRRTLRTTSADNLEASHLQFPSIARSKSFTGTPLRKGRKKVDSPTSVIIASPVVERQAEWDWVECTMQRSDDGNNMILTIIGTDDNYNNDEDDDNLHTVTVPISTLNHQVLLSNDNAETPSDLVSLTHLHEPAVVECLQQRYAQKLVYTATGPVLIALNPFCTISDLYSSATMQKYWTAAEQGLDFDDPHVFRVADYAFRCLMRAVETTSNNNNDSTLANQTILVSGESGAGKTVTTKFVMQYLATLSQRSGGKTTNTTNTNKDSIESQVLQSNPILESFGNARTVRNDNSSRFGKFIAMQFTKSGKLVGTKIDTYLLEKVRLIKQNAGERNYHVFFELLSGKLDKAEQAAYHLKETTSPTEFSILCNGVYDRRDGIKDVDTYKELKQAMNIIKSDTKKVFAVVAAIMHASNLTFEQVDEESNLVSSNAAIDPACTLLGVSAVDLSEALCFFNVVIGGEPFRRTLPLDKAAKGLDALLKAVYGALFDWLVERINDNIGFKQSDNSETDLYHSPVAEIGVLDIFGFESFTVNSFEQLCINYCNEKLQQQFNQFVLQNEQAEYVKEGIQWDFIDFAENRDVLDLIEDQRNGILRILDDQGKIPGQDDKTFALDLYTRCLGKPRFVANKNQRGFLMFAIEHYAGTVEYTTDNFVAKNKDELPKESLDLLKSSTNTFVKELANLIGRHQSIPSGSSDQEQQQRKSSNNNATTVAAHFRRQLEDLRKKIESTSPHYIRCIKPNDKLVPNNFQVAVVAEQLRCNGILETIRVTRLGFTQHYPHAEFVLRYKHFAKGSAVKIKSIDEYEDTAEYNYAVSIVCQNIVDVIHKKFEELDNTNAGIEQPASAQILMQCGKTKVFMRHHAFEALERLRVSEQSKAATAINTNIRRHIAMKAYKVERDQFCKELQRDGLTFDQWYHRRYNKGKEIEEKLAQQKAADTSVKENGTEQTVRYIKPSKEDEEAAAQFKAKLKARIKDNSIPSNPELPKWVFRNGKWAIRDDNDNSCKDSMLDNSVRMLRSNWKSQV